MMNDSQRHISGLIPVPSAVLRTDTSLSTDCKLRNRTLHRWIFSLVFMPIADRMVRMRQRSFDIPFATSLVIRILSDLHSRRVGFIRTNILKTKVNVYYI